MRVAGRRAQLPSAVRVHKPRRARPVSPACAATPVPFLRSASLTGMYPTEGPSSVLFTAGSQPLGQCPAQVRKESGYQDREGRIPEEATRRPRQGRAQRGQWEAPEGCGVRAEARSPAGSQGGQREGLGAHLCDLGARALPHLALSRARRGRPSAAGFAAGAAAQRGAGLQLCRPRARRPPPTPSTVTGAPGVQ